MHGRVGDRVFWSKPRCGFERVANVGMSHVDGEAAYDDAAAFLRRQIVAREAPDKALSLGRPRACLILVYSDGGEESANNPSDGEGVFR